MALDVLRLQNPWVTGVSKGLENLTQHKLKQIERQTTAGSLKSLGYPPELALLPEPLMQAEINNINANRRQSEKLAHQSGIQSQKQAQQREYSRALESLIGGNQSAQGVNQNYSQQEQQPVNYRNEMLDYSMGNLPERAQQQFQQPQNNENVSGQATSPGLNQSLSGLTEQQATNLVKIAQKQQALKSNDNKEVREYLQPLVEKRKKLEDAKRNNKLLIKLAEKGDIRSGNAHALLDKVGLADFGRNVDTQVAQKTIANQALESAGAFGPGAKITNYLEQTFQRGLATLWNTPEGIIAISRIRKAMDNLQLKDIQLTEQIIKQNGGRIPYDIGSQVHKLLAPYRDELDRKTVEAIARPNLPKINEIPKDKMGKKIRYNGDVYKLENGKWKLVV